MALTEYPFVISTDTANGVVDLDSLTLEIAASSITVALDNLTRSGDALGVWFKAGLTQAQQTTLAVVVAAHAGTPGDDEPRDDMGNPVVTTYAFAYIEGQKTRFKKFKYDVPVGTTGIFDELITTQVWIQGGTYRVKGANADDMDKADFAVVDKDDVLGIHTALGIPLGTPIEVDHYVVSEWIESENPQADLRVTTAGKLYAGLYLRAKYESAGQQGDADPRVFIRYLWFEE